MERSKVEDTRQKTNRHGLKYVVYYTPSSGLNISEVISYCRTKGCGKIIAVRNTRDDVMSLCRATGALPVTAARRNSELAASKGASWCKGVVYV